MNLKLTKETNLLTGIIIQARSGSSRLPNKMNLDFYKNHSILDIIISRIRNKYPNTLVVLATTKNVLDDVLVNRVKKHEIEVFRGNEENVLDRFIKTASHYNIDNIIRVCADNPFLDMVSLNELKETFENSNADYMAYKTAKGIPTVKTHYGFWAEAVSLKALKKIEKLTDDNYYLEHVTNFIYENHKDFEIEFLSIDDYLNEGEIRLTIDTKTDFETVKEVYKEVVNEGEDFSIEEVYNKVISRDDWLSSMSSQIKEQKK